MNHSHQQKEHVTILLPGGQLEPGPMRSVTDIAEKYNLTLYVTTMQNIKLLGATPENRESVRKELLELGLTLKGPGKFPVPKVCIGQPYCNLGLADTFALSRKILARFGGREGVKPKYKIAVSGCPACCGGSKISDIGIVATRGGYELYVGGKGGPLPRTGARVARGMSEDEVVGAVGRIADFHAAKTPKKQRLFKLLDDPEFPFSQQ